LLDVTVVDFSFALCRRDALCADIYAIISDSSVYVEASRSAFDEVLPVAILHDKALVTTVLPYVEACLANVSATDCQLVTTMWLAVLRNMQPCVHDNEVWKAGFGCVCTQGKHCDDGAVSVKISDVYSFIVILALLAVANVVYAAIVIRISNKFWTILDNIRQNFYAYILAGNQVINH
jgi:hypothetical protein